MILLILKVHDHLFLYRLLSVTYIRTTTFLIEAKQRTSSRELLKAARFSYPGNKNPTQHVIEF